MKRTIKWTIAAVIASGLAASVYPVYVAGFVLGFWQPFTRPAPVTSKARFVSRMESGFWFDCSVDAKRNVDVCKAWDYKGALLADGDFRLEDEGRAATQSELRPSAVFSSGGQAYMIYLFGEHGAHSRTLLPVRGEGNAVTRP